MTSRCSRSGRASTAVNSICSGITRQLYANVIARRSFRLVRGRRGRAEALAVLVVHLQRGGESALVGTAPSRARVARLDRIRCDDCNCRETRDVRSSHRYAVRTGVAAAAMTWRLASQPPVAPPAILSACAT